MNVLNVNSPAYLLGPLNVMSSIIVGSERPFALTANKMIRYELPGSKLSIKNETGGRCGMQKNWFNYNIFFSLCFVSFLVLRRFDVLPFSFNCINVKATI